MVRTQTAQLLINKDNSMTTTKFGTIENKCSNTTAVLLSDGTSEEQDLIFDKDAKVLTPRADSALLSYS